MEELKSIFAVGSNVLSSAVQFQDLVSAKTLIIHEMLVLHAKPPVKNSTLFAVDCAKEANRYMNFQEILKKTDQLLAPEAAQNQIRLPGLEKIRWDNHWEFPKREKSCHLHFYRCSRHRKQIIHA